MARLSSNRIAWQYHSDDGNIYRVAAEKALTDQAKLGGEAWAGEAPPKPASIKMRRVTVRDTANGFSRVVPVYSLDAAILAAAATINCNRLADSYAYTHVSGVISEQRPRQNVTTQST